jgi:hypothetical protein
MSGPRAPHPLRHEPQSTPLKFEEPLKVGNQIEQPYDPSGSDVPATNYQPNDEYVTITNTGTTDTGRLDGP